MQSAAALRGKQIGTFFIHQRADFFLNYSMSADSNGDGVLRRLQSAFRVWRIGPLRDASEVRWELVGLKESAVLWQAEGGRQLKVDKNDSGQSLYGQEGKKSPFFRPNDIRLPHMFTFSPLPSLLRL